MIVTLESENGSIDVNIKRGAPDARDQHTIFIKHMPRPSDSMVSGSGNYQELRVGEEDNVDLESRVKYIGKKMGVKGLNQAFSFEPKFTQEIKEFGRPIYESDPRMKIMGKDFVIHKLTLYFKKVWESYLKRMRIMMKMCNNNIEYINGLERKQSCVGPEGNMGIFATKDYKRGETITRYGVHGLCWVNRYGRTYMEYDKQTLPFEMFDENNCLTPEMINYWDEWRCRKYWASIRSNELGEDEEDSEVSIIGFPDPELNKDSRFWGHLINDLNYVKDETWTHKQYWVKDRNNVCLGVQGQDSEKLPKKVRDLQNVVSDNLDMESAKIYDRINVIAFKDIKAGEELGTSYGPCYWMGKEPPKDAEQRDAMEDYDKQYGSLMPRGGIYNDPRHRNMTEEQIKYWKTKIGLTPNLPTFKKVKIKN